MKLLKEKFGEDVVIKKYEKSKGWLNKKLVFIVVKIKLINVLQIFWKKNQFGRRYGF